MGKVAVKELNGWKLDYAVAHYIYKRPCTFYPAYGTFLQPFTMKTRDGDVEFSPTSKWSDAGSLITMEGVNLLKVDMGWKAYVDGHDAHTDPFPLPAVMRAVLSANGHVECEIPYMD
ncbi:phage protein NinX family protein [Pseudomonas yamanorum]